VNDPHEICAALRAYRIRGRIKQQLVARALGVAQSQISRWESGRDLPRPHNIEAIKSLIWGETTQLQSLAFFVRTSALPLALFDGERRLLAAGLPFQRPHNDLERFAWALDPRTNPAVAEIDAQYRAILAAPHGTVGLDIVVPFAADGEPWLARLRQTIYRVDGQAACIAEIHFLPRPEGDRTTAPTLTRIRMPYPASSIPAPAGMLRG
jgi:transcriptional regulator with XRE-family HTH domain